MLSRGPEGTPFEGGVFVTELIFPTDYPLSPPKMKFLSEMFHPNGVCVLVMLIAYSGSTLRLGM